MVIDYDNIYDESIKELLVLLQEYIVSIDKEKYNALTDEYKEQYFLKVITEVKECEGKILLYKENNKIIGRVVGLINNEEEKTYDFNVPKRGRITELVVSKSARSKGIGTKLLKAMEEHLKSVGCEDILIGVFGYNSKAIKFYEKNGYHIRMLDMTKGKV